MTRTNRSTADADRSRELHDEGLQQLRAALFVDDEQADLFTERETIVIAKVTYKHNDLAGAIQRADWAETSRIAALLDELLSGLQKLDLANTFA